MANDKTRFKIRGNAVYPKTDKAYRWDAAANRSVADVDGNYELQVAVPKDKADALKTALIKFFKDNGGKGAPDLSIKPQIDKETGEPTGYHLVKATQYGKDKTDNVRKIAHYDGKAKPLGDGFRLTSGSEIILDCYPTLRKMPKPGVKLNIGAIQVIQYVEPQAFNPFEAVADAYDSAGDTETEDDPPFQTEGEGEEDGSQTDF